LIEYDLVFESLKALKGQVVADPALHGSFILMDWHVVVAKVLALLLLLFLLMVIILKLPTD
jgi:hypothetical protein